MLGYKPSLTNIAKRVCLAKNKLRTHAGRIYLFIMCADEVSTGPHVMRRWFSTGHNVHHKSAHKRAVRGALMSTPTASPVASTGPLPSPPSRSSPTAVTRRPSTFTGSKSTSAGTAFCSARCDDDDSNWQGGHSLLHLLQRDVDTEHAGQWSHWLLVGGA